VFFKLNLRHKSVPIPKESKTIPVYGSPDRGDGEDHNRYFKCWNCGFICDSKRDYLGDGESSARTTQKEYTLLDDKGVATGYCYGAYGHDETTCVANGGTWKTKRYVTEVDAGCPSCGSPNWRGDY
jgi:hypothetical protein